MATAISPLAVPLPVLPPLAGVRLGAAAAGIRYKGRTDLVMMELAAVSPPVGITVAVMRSVAPDVPTNVIFRGCYPFLGLTILLTFALIAWPPLALWLPSVTR